ncbi:MAG: Gfo/Idh/MocA family oxidoreductase, partial [Ruminococcaceae bacterium]|nr:Gfo/Idh/MocA family oxidoreductase [Oscillospiraceae bacterium]
MWCYINKVKNKTIFLLGVYIMGKVYGVVLIGCGHIGQEHIENIYYRDNIKIVGVVDFVKERAELFSRKYSCGEPVLYDTDYHEMIKRDDVDIVIIATYVKTHLAILADCLAAGKHVLCEKPIASTLEEGEEFYKLVKGS